MPTIDRLVPNRREEYIANEGQACESGPCTGCDGGAAVASHGANDYCAACWSYMHGFDQAEEKLCRATLGAAVAAALDVGASEQLVRAAVDDALRERVRVDGAML